MWQVIPTEELYHFQAEQSALWGQPQQAALCGDNPSRQPCPYCPMELPSRLHAWQAPGQHWVPFTGLQRPGPVKRVRFACGSKHRPSHSPSLELTTLQTQDCRVALQHDVSLLPASGFSHTETNTLWLVVPSLSPGVSPDVSLCHSGRTP